MAPSMKVHSSGTLNNARVHKPRSPALRVVRILLLSVLIAHCVYIFVTGALIFIYKFTNPPTTFLMIYRSLVNRWDVQKPIPLQTSQIPSYLRRMLVSVEDGKFYDHHGIDMEAFKRARDLNQKIGRPMYGGSTITMQVARTLFLLPNKSYLRKYLEVIAALEMEVILSKARILELYFGYAEWGKGIFGIERASRLYYGKGVASIQVDQAARLIALLSSPIKYKPDTIYFTRKGSDLKKAEGWKSLSLTEYLAELPRGFNPFSLIGEEWMLIGAGTPEDWNAMTASWGGLGVLWNCNVATCYVRPTRHTFSYMEGSERFTLSFLGGGQKNYPEKDYHRMYVGEIERVWRG